MAAETRRSDTPAPGFYLLRLVRGGPWVGASILHDATGWTVMRDGESQGPASDPWSLPLMEKVHFYGAPATEADVLFRVGRKRWAEIYAPSDPAANPRTAIDIDRYTPF